MSLNPSSYITVSLAEAYKAYVLENNFNKLQSSEIKSAIFRFIVTGFNLAKPIKRISDLEAIKRLSLLEDIKVDSNLDLEKVLERSFIILEPSNVQRRKTLFHINKFIAWLDEKYVIPQSKTNTLKTQEVKFFRPHDNRKTAIKTEKKIKPSQYSLRLNIDYYEPLYKKDPKKKVYVERQLNRISGELESFRSFQYVTLGNVYNTVKSSVGCIQRIMGYMYNQGFELDKITITAIVPFIPIKIRHSDHGNDYGSYLIAKEKAQEENAEAGQEIVIFVEKFFANVNSSMLPSSKLDYIDAITTLARFLYQRETNTSRYDNYEDIPLILIIRKKRRSIDLDAQVHYRDCRSDSLPITWEQVVQAMEHCRLDVGMSYYTKIRNVRRSDGSVYKRVGRCKSETRTLTATAMAYMRFLMLACFVIIGPDRQEVYRNLRIGKSLKYGVYDSFNNFTPAEHLKDVSKAKFYIDPEYKTKKTYGRIIQEIPNHQFNDGRSFYDYWREWLFVTYTRDNKEIYGLRNSFETDLAEDDIVFPIIVGKNKGQIASQNSIYTRIITIMEKVHGVKIGCHKLRNIYISHERVIEANYKERASTAFLMKHSLETQERIYRIQTSQQKLQPGQDLLKRVNEEAFEESKELIGNSLTKKLIPVKNPNVPYGYSLFDGKLEEDPVEQKALELMSLLRKDGSTYKDIAAELNLQNYSPRRGSSWSREKVRHFFRTNPDLKEVNS